MSLISGSQKGKKEKWNGGGGTNTLNVLEVTIAKEGKGLATVAARPLCTSVIRSSNQQSEHRSLILEDGVPITHPGSWRLLARENREWRAGRERMGSWYHAMSWNWLNLATIYHPSLPLEVARFISSKIVTPNRFCQYNCPVGRKTDSWCFLHCHLPRILCAFAF